MDIHAETYMNEDSDDLLRLDPETLDPKLIYRFARNSPERLARLATKGYRIVKRSQDGVRTMYDSVLDKKKGSADDHITTGDTILVCKPKEDYEQRVERRRKLTEARLQSAEENFRSKAKEHSSGLEKPIEVVGLDAEDNKEMKS